MSRRRILAVGLAAVAAAAATFLWLSWPRDDPVRVTVGDAVRSFREQDSRNAGLRAGSGPAPGVYRYATRGSESVATDFLSTTHSYDGVSTITVSAGGCGEVERWEVLEERWNEAESCPRSAAGERWTVTEFHEFFGIAQEDAYTCRGESMQRPPFAAPSARFTSRCTSADSSVLNTSRIRGIATVTVGGKKYEAVHTVSSSVVSGDTTGNATSEDWRRRSDGLLLRRSVSSNALTSAGGGARYSERYTIELIDPRPRR